MPELRAPQGWSGHAAGPSPTGDPGVGRRARWIRPRYGRDGAAAGRLGPGVLASFRATATEVSLGRAMFGAVSWLLVTAPARRIRRGRPDFMLSGRRFPYLPLTLATERRAEIPLGLAFLRAARPGERILEVGNVLGRHDATGRDIVDRYESAAGVINDDILTYAPVRRYDRIVSISTLEHVGFDEPVPAPGAFARALEHLVVDLLAPEGRFLATVPLGYNPEVDSMVLSGRAPRGISAMGLRRIGLFNEWRETPLEQIGSRDTAGPYPGASVIAVLTSGPSPFEAGAHP